MKNFYVYILCSQKNGTLYIGVTSNLDRRIRTHKAGQVRGFTQKYGVCHLIYFECAASAFSGACSGVSELKNIKFPTHRGFPDACVGEPQVYESVTVAIRREKQLKKWNRSWKIKLIEKANPTWRDLFDSQE